tara:strand:+ start:137 stop:316 length:180 start_codon:yes stop_codon:yes gene_type:complete
MRFKYEITDKENKTETLYAMSYKKMLRQLKPGNIYSIKYKNKKNHELIKIEDLSKKKAE